MPRRPAGYPPPRVNSLDTASYTLLLPPVGCRRHLDLFSFYFLCRHRARRRKSIRRGVSSSSPLSSSTHFRLRLSSSSSLFVPTVGGTDTTRRIGATGSHVIGRAARDGTGRSAVPLSGRPGMGCKRQHRPSHRRPTTAAVELCRRRRPPTALTPSAHRRPHRWSVR